MRNLRCYLIGFLITALFFLSATSIFAYDKEVICSNSCTGFSGALFSEMDIKPGDSVNKTLSIKNESDESLNIKLSSEKNNGTDDILAERITIIIYDDGTILYSGNFLEFLGQNIDLGSISQDQTKVFEIHTAFPIDSGNVYQDKRVNFTLMLYLQGEESQNTEVLTTSTSSPASSSSSDTTRGSVLGDSIIGQVLGLSDTGGLFINLFYFITGFFMIILGFKTIRKYYR